MSREGETRPLMSGGLWASSPIVIALAFVAGLVLWKRAPPTLSEWIWLIATAGLIAIRAPHARRNRGNRIVDRRHDGAERLLLPAMFLTSLALPLATIATPLFRFADYALPASATVSGAVLEILFLWLFWRSHHDLGRNWSAGVEMREAHHLVSAGVYGRIRHPMYAAIWLAVLAQPLLVRNWIGGALVVAAFATMYLIRVPREEAMMRDMFGVAWDEYALRTGRIVPRWRDARTGKGINPAA